MSHGVFSLALPAPMPGAGASLRKGPKTAFLVGRENHLVPMIVQSVLQSGVVRCNPLMIYGRSGVGKSHLARGIAREFANRCDAAKVVCLTGHELAQDYARAVQLQNVDIWRDEMRGLRMLVLDEIEHLASKAAAQQEFLATLDALMQQQSQVIVTARSSPRQLTSLGVLLRSRLMEGLELPLAVPSPVTRLALLRYFAANRGFSLSDAACNLLANGLTGSVTAILGALAELELEQRAAQTNSDCAHAAAQESPVAGIDEMDTGDVKAVRQYLARQQTVPAPGLRTIALAAARYFQLSLGDLKSGSRQRPVVSARSMAMYLSRLLTTKNLNQIGSYFGGRDHSTVLHACHKVESLIKVDAEIGQALSHLQSRLTAR